MIDKIVLSFSVSAKKNEGTENKYVNWKKVKNNTVLFSIGITL